MVALFNGITDNRGIDTGWTQIKTTSNLKQTKRQIQQTTRGERNVHERTTAQAIAITMVPCHEARHKLASHSSDQGSIYWSNEIMAYLPNPFFRAIRCV